MDISVQELGGIEGLFALALQNRISVTATIEEIELDIPKRNINTEIASYYRRKRIQPATAVGVYGAYAIDFFAALEPSEKTTTTNGKIIVQHPQTLPDIVVQNTNSLEYLFEMAMLNGLSINSQPISGTQLKQLNKRQESKEPQPLAKFKSQPKIVAMDRQSLQDLTLQTTGSLEHIFELALLNGVSVTATPEPGDEYNTGVAESATEIVRYYQVRGIKPATGIAITPQQLFEDGLFERGLFE